MITLGIDIGGSGIKAAPVDLSTGLLIAPRERIPTPQPSTPEAVAEVVAQLVSSFSSQIPNDGMIGVTYPGVVKNGLIYSAANVDKTWIGIDADALLTAATKHPCAVLNDAQAAALAEVRYGAGKGHQGMVLVLTFGTGIGSGLVFRGQPLYGVEFGHIRINGKDAELLAAASVRDRENLSWKEWSRRVNVYLDHLEAMIWPDLIIVGGGVSAKAEKWVPLLESRTPIAVAELQNEAGIVGAALAASLGSRADDLTAAPKARRAGQAKSADAPSRD